MVQVVGRNPNYEVDCTNCGNKLAFTRKDVRAGQPIPGSEERDHRSVITCPGCRQAVDVTTKMGATSRETAAQQEWDELRRDSL